MGGPEQIWPDAGSVRWPPGWSIELVATTGSTNADLAASSAAGASDRSVLVTAHQTAGRGRLDRRWEAPPGANLLVSILFRTVPDPAVELTHRVGLAAVAACRRVTGMTPTLKWPNDLLLDDRKLAGILAERTAEGAVVVGLGLNVGWAPKGAARLGDDVSPLDVLRELLVAFDDLPADIRDRYRSSLSTLGRRVQVELPAGDLEGTALDVADDGRLVVLDGCGVTHRIDVGDIVHLRAEVPPS